MRRTHLWLAGAVVILAAWWGMERAATEQWRSRLQRARWNREELDRLRGEHDRLARAAPSADELAQWRRDLAARRRPEAGPSRGAPPKPDTGALAPGVWTTPAEWSNRGRATPEAALETVLWAAAGGDLDTLKTTLELDRDARTKAAGILAGLPEATRRRYPQPEDLVALFVARDVPLGSLQRVAQQGDDQPGRVTEFLRVRNADGLTRPVFLSLRQSPDGWRLVVPAAAVDATKDLASLPSPGR